MALNYPNDADGDALRSLAEAGCDMSRPAEIDFQVAAEDEAAARQVAASAARLGYKTEVVFDDEPPQPGEDPLPPWTCYCVKAMVPTYDAIVAAQAELNRIAEPLGAYVDGWGSYGNA
jgi:regulator of RNase E activity RraB